MQNMTLLYTLCAIGILSALILVGYFIYLIAGRKNLINRIVLNYIYVGMIACIFYGLMHNSLSHPAFFNSLISMDFSNIRIQAYTLAWLYRAMIYFTVFAIWLRILLVRARQSGRKTGVFRMLYIHAALISTAWFTDFEKLLYYGGTIDIHHLTHWIGGVIGCGMLILLEYVFMEKNIIMFLGISENFQNIRSKLLIITFGMTGLLLLAIFGLVIGCINIDPSSLFMGKLLFYSVLLLIPLLLIILRITADFQKNLHNAVAALNSAAQQDFTYIVAIDSKDEFGELAKSLEELKSSFQKVISKVRESADEVNGSARVINTSLSEFIANISSFFNRQSEMTGQQVTVALQAQEDVKKIAGTITAIAGELEQQSELITATSGLIRKMESSITDITTQTESAGQQAKTLFSIADEGKSSMLSTLSSFQHVERKSGQIQDLSGMISDISEKTKLLAINTSIEAANVGIHGRGFKVLAQELRNLAENSAANTGTIIQNLAEINFSIKESLKRMEISQQGFLEIHSQAENSRQLNEHVHNAMQNENRLLHEITLVSNRLVDITSSISAFSRQLLEGSTLIFQVFIDFQKRATEDEQSFRENSTQVQELIRMLQDHMQRNLAIADELNAEITEFTI